MSPDFDKIVLILAQTRSQLHVKAPLIPSDILLVVIDQTLWQPWIKHVCAQVSVDVSLVDPNKIHELFRESADSLALLGVHLWGLAIGNGVDAAHARSEIGEASRWAASAALQAPGRQGAHATFDAVILAGGKGSRMGNVSKADLEVGGRRLLDIVLEAANGASTTVVVGDVAVPDGVLLTREEPAGTGPAAGLLAGLEAIESPSEWVLVLACDLPDAPAAVGQLLTHLPDVEDAVDGICLHEENGRLQHLLACYRFSALQEAGESVGDMANRGVWRLMKPLNLQAVSPGGASVQDLDTPEQLRQWVADAKKRRTGQQDETPVWRAFITRACQQLGLPIERVNEGAVLDLTRAVAHGGARPMAPVAAYICGLALHDGVEDPASVGRVLEQAVASAPRPAEG